uniref:Uncharacterized protein n=1 Tax=Aegilops tauschii TaxID=37682 RepID=M8CNU8_AEGTA
MKKPGEGVHSPNERRTSWPSVAAGAGADARTLAMGEGRGLRSCEVGGGEGEGRRRGGPEEGDKVVVAAVTKSLS